VSGGARARHSFAIAAAATYATTLLAFGFVAIPFLIGRVCLQSLLEADYHFGASNAIRLLSPLAGVVVNGVLGVLGILTVTSAIAVWTAAQAAGTVYLGWFVARRLEGYARPDLALARRTVRFGAKTHVGQIMGLGNWRLDQWFR
jgi:hypothetical protein